MEKQEQSESGSGGHVSQPQITFKLMSNMRTPKLVLFGDGYVQGVALADTKQAVLFTVTSQVWPQEKRSVAMPGARCTQNKVHDAESKGTFHLRECTPIQCIHKGSGYMTSGQSSG